MRKYIKDNLESILIGFCLGIIFMIIKEATKDIILSIAILYDKKPL